MEPATLESGGENTPEILLREAIALSSAPRGAAPVFRLTRERTLTRRGVIWLGQTCNARCQFCYFIRSVEDRNDPKHAFMPYEKAKAICRTMVDTFGNNAVDIEGGEPTLWHHIPELVAYCKSIGLAPTIITNGIVLDSKERLLTLKDAGVRDFLVSVLGLGPVHDAAVGVQGAHRRQMQALANMTSLGMPFRFNCVMTKQVIPHLPVVAKLAIATGARVVNFLAYNPFFDQAGGERRRKEHVASYSEIKPLLAEALDILAAAHVEGNARYLPFCAVESRHWRSVYDFQQLSYDPHEADLSTQMWTALPLQMISAEPLSPPVAFSHLLRPTPVPPTISRLVRWKYVRAMVFGLHRALVKIASKKYATREQGYRAIGRHFAKRTGYDFCPSCQACALKRICDGVPSAYVHMYGWTELSPVKSIATTDDPCHFARAQEKVVEEEVPVCVP